jgi:hypothetical protein
VYGLELKAISVQYAARVTRAINGVDELVIEGQPRAGSS